MNISKACDLLVIACAVVVFVSSMAEKNFTAAAWCFIALLAQLRLLIGVTS